MDEIEKYGGYLLKLPINAYLFNFVCCDKSKELCTRIQDKQCKTNFFSIHTSKNIITKP